MRKRAFSYTDSGCLCGWRTRASILVSTGVSSFLDPHGNASLLSLFVDEAADHLVVSVAVRTGYGPARADREWRDQRHLASAWTVPCRVIPRAYCRTRRAVEHDLILCCHDLEGITRHNALSPHRRGHRTNRARHVAAACGGIGRASTVAWMRTSLPVNPLLKERPSALARSPRRGNDLASTPSPPKCSGYSPPCRPSTVFWHARTAAARASPVRSRF